MSFRDVPDVDPAIHVGNDLFVVLTVLEDRLEPLKGRSAETLWLFDCINYGLNGAESLEHMQPRIVHGAYSKNLRKYVS